MRSIFLLAALLATLAQAIETGPANSALRVPSGGGRPKFGHVPSQRVAKTTTYTLAVLDTHVDCDTSGGGWTLTIPAAASSNAGQTAKIKKTTADLNVLTLATGLSTTLNTLGEEVEIQSNGTAWEIIHRVIPAISTAYTPLLTTNAGVDAVTLNATGKTDPWGAWQRIGNCIKIDIGWENGSGGAPSGTAGDMYVSLPTGITLDTTYLTSMAQLGTVVGTVQTFSWINGSQYNPAIAQYLTGHIVVQKTGTNTFLTLGNAGSNTTAHYMVNFPVTGWNTAH